jgi:hypothetical protein
MESFKFGEESFSKLFIAAFAVLPINHFLHNLNRRSGQFMHLLGLFLSLLLFRLNLLFDVMKICLDLSFFLR